MQEFLKGSKYHAYSQVYMYMKQKLKEQFGDDIIITTFNRKPDVVTFCSNASPILIEFYKEQRKKDSKFETMCIFQTAAKLIRNDIKSMDTSCEIYPSREQMADSEAALKYIPETLQELLRVLFTGKGYGIGTSINWTAIMQGTSPKVILAPSQFGLASQMHHKLSSRFIVDTLHKHGFRCSYAEILIFERAVQHYKEVNYRITGQNSSFSLLLTMLITTLEL